MKIQITTLLVLVFSFTLVSSLGYTAVSPFLRICPPLSSPANGQVFASGITYGSIATYRCFFGFTLSPPQSRVRTCLINGVWSGSAPVCRSSLPLCPPLNSPANGAVSINRRTPGGTATYSCNDGFTVRPASSQIRTCQTNGQWTGVDPGCQANRVNCGDPGTPANGRRLLSSTLEGSVVRYFCSRGFELEGDQQRTCQSNGQWSGSLPVCRRIIDCGPLSNPENGVVTFSSTQAGSTARYSCNSGFILRGNQVRVCQANGVWSGQDPVCIRNVVDCGQLQNPQNGFVSFSSTTQGSIAIYTCNEGFVLVGNQRRRCQRNGQWSGRAPVCESELINCGNLENPQNGFVSLTGTSEGSVATYSCQAGFRLVGNRRRRCLSTGDWSGQEPSCRRRTRDCGNLNNPTNGVVSFRSTTIGSTATYRCNRGFTLVGNRRRSCQRNGEWSGQAPTCQRRQATDCGVLSAPANGRVDLTGATVGSSAVYSCNRFFFLTGGSRIRVCRSNGQWSGNMPRCLRRRPGPFPPGPFPPGPNPPGPFPPGPNPPGPFPPGPTPLPPGGLPCTPPPNPANGQVFVTEDERNSIATYECNTGFRLARGDRVRFCQADGTYSGRAPVCIRGPGPFPPGPNPPGPFPPTIFPPTPFPPGPIGGICPRLSPPKDGLVKVTNFDEGGQATYSCFSGFRLVGASIRVCRRSGFWSLSEPVCVPRRFIGHLNSNTLKNI